MSALLHKSSNILLHKALSAIFLKNKWLEGPIDRVFKKLLFWKIIKVPHVLNHIGKIGNACSANLAQLFRLQVNKPQQRCCLMRLLLYSLSFRFARAIGKQGYFKSFFVLFRILKKYLKRLLPNNLPFSFFHISIKI